MWHETGNSEFGKMPQEGRGGEEGCWMLGDLMMLKAPIKRSQREILHGLIRALCSDCHSLFSNVGSCAEQWKTLQYQHEIIMIMIYQNVRIFSVFFFSQTPKVVQDVHVITPKTDKHLRARTECVATN